MPSNNPPSPPDRVVRGKVVRGKVVRGRVVRGRVSQDNRELEVHLGC
ncbi:MAG: hypothetical protein VB855_11365 [Pirellulaceae bacterium]